MSQAEPAPVPPRPARKPLQVRWLLAGGIFLIPVILGFYFAYALLGIFILAGLLAALASLRRARDLADMPTSKIRSAAQGPVELLARGSATDPDGRPLTGPLTGSPCCYWQLDAQRLIKRDKDTEWQTEAFARSAPEMLPLSDGTGICHVMIAEAEIHAGIREEREAPPELRQSLAPLFPAHQRAGLDRQAHWRLVETRLPADKDLYAMGRFLSFRSNEVPFDDSWADRMAGADEGIPPGLRKIAQIGLGKTAPPRQAAVLRWQAAMRRLEGVPPDAALAGTAMAHVLGPDRRRPLVVSAVPERGLARSYRLQAFGGVAMALIAAGFLLFLLFEENPEALQALQRSVGLAPHIQSAPQPED